MLKGSSCNIVLVVLGSASLTGFAPTLQAQTPTPTTYSYTEDPAFSIAGPMTIKVARDGSKETIDQVIPVGPGRDKEFRSHLLYDFQAHKIYTKVMSESNACSVVEYTSPAAPWMFDALSGGTDMMQELSENGKAKTTQLGPGTVNGFPAKIVEIAPTKPGEPKGKIWLAATGNYPLKVAVEQDGKEETLIEVKQLVFTKPPPSNFIPPSGCEQLGGSTNATGGHVESGGSSGTKSAFKVTAVHLSPVPTYTGTCPAKIRMTATITTDGPGKVWYQFSAGNSDPGETLTFTAAGTKTVMHVMTFNVDLKVGHDMGVSAAVQAVMEDSQGGHTDFGTGSNNADFSINCK